MAIDLTLEKERSLSTQDMYDIIAFSTEAANDNGFMNSFIFNRALYLFAAIILYPEQKEEFSHIISENINTAWDKLLQEGVIDNMVKDFKTDLDMLAEYGKTWLDEYTEYAHSARGLLDTIQMFSVDIVKAAAEQLQSATTQSGVKEVLDIADKWGMNNQIVDEKEALPASSDSLFE